MKQYMILPITHIWNNFLEVLTDLDMPDIDIDAALSRVFDCLKELDLVEKKLQVVCIDMATHDGLFEQEQFSNYQRRQIHNAVETLGRDLFRYYVEQGLYVDGKAPYDYKGTHDGCALLLGDTSFGFTSPLYRTRYF